MASTYVVERSYERTATLILCRKLFILKLPHCSIHFGRGIGFKETTELASFTQIIENRL